MSRTYRRSKKDYKKGHLEKDTWYRCRCNWCINIKWRDRRKDSGV